MLVLYQLLILSLFFTIDTYASNMKSTLISKNMDKATAKNTYHYNLDPNTLASLCNHLSDYNDNLHQHHQHQILGEFILPYDLASTFQRLIVMKDNDPYIKATEKIGDNINKVSEWNKVDNIIDYNNKKSIYSREISYVHNRKSSMFAPKSTSHNLLQILSLNAFDTGHVNHALLLGFMNLSHVPFCHNCHYETLWSFQTFRGRSDSKNYGMTRVTVSLDIKGLPTSIYQQFIKNEITKDLKSYVEEFRKEAQQSNQKYVSNNLSNDEKELLSTLTKVAMIDNIETPKIINNLNNNFWTLPTGLQENHTSIGTFVLSFLVLYKKYYQNKWKGINTMSNMSIISKFRTTVSTYQKIINNGNIFTKIRKIF